MDEEEGGEEREIGGGERRGYRVEKEIRVTPTVLRLNKGQEMTLRDMKLANVH